MNNYHFPYVINKIQTSKKEQKGKRKQTLQHLARFELATSLVKYCPPLSTKGQGTAADRYRCTINPFCMGLAFSYFAEWVSDAKAYMALCTEVGMEWWVPSIGDS